MHNFVKVLFVLNPWMYCTMSLEGGKIQCATFFCGPQKAGRGLILEESFRVILSSLVMPKGILVKIQYSWMQNENTIHRFNKIIFIFLVWAASKLLIDIVQNHLFYLK